MINISYAAEYLKLDDPSQYEDDYLLGMMRDGYYHYSVNEWDSVPSSDITRRAVQKLANRIIFEKSHPDILMHHITRYTEAQLLAVLAVPTASPATVITVYVGCIYTVSFRIYKSKLMHTINKRKSLVSMLMDDYIRSTDAADVIDDIYRPGNLIFK